MQFDIRKQAGLFVAGICGLTAYYYFWKNHKKNLQDGYHPKYCQIKLKNKEKFIDISKEEYESIQIQNLECLFFEPNLNPNILKTLTNLKLSQITRISINSNNVTSLQQLCKIQLNSLIYLEIHDNKITNICALRKMNAPNLNFLQMSLKQFKIDNNPIVQGFQRIHEAKLSDLQYLWIQQFQTDYLTRQDLSYLLKMDANYFSRIYAGSSRMKIRQNFIDKLSKKCGGNVQIRQFNE